MGTVYFRTSPYLGSVGTTRLLNVTTGSAVQIVLNSGYSAMTIFNEGSGTLVWGDANIAVNSGNNLFVQSRVEWLGLQDAWSVYVRAESVATLIGITQYNV